MRHAYATALTCVLLAGCSDYNLWGDVDPDRPGTDDTGGPIVDGPQPDIKVEPQELSFGWRLVGCPAEPQEVTVTNIGDLQLDVSELRVAGSGADMFSIDGSPQSLAPGESFSFDVGFTARSVADYVVDIQVDSNDPDQPTAGVDATGHGSTTAINEEVFFQPDVSDVDVLWVVDNSGSMSSIVGHLGDRFASFLSTFDTMDIDYQIAVTSTDMYDPAHQGRFLGPEKIMSRADTDPVGLFVAATDLGSSGSGSEQGMDAAYAALTSPLVDTDNAGFVRDGAVLAVVVISDEDDDSAISNADFTRWLDGYKGDADLTSLSAIVGDWDGGFGIGCTSSGFPPVTAEAAERYVKVQRATGGTFQSICDEDFDEVLSYLAFGASGLSFDFELSKVPESIGGITVTVDGVEVARHPANGWFYDSAKNAIHFSRRAVPGPNATVVISYPVKEDC
jgi:hypothetical protein